MPICLLRYGHLECAGGYGRESVNMQVHMTLAAFLKSEA
jgi:hypothetical protein